MDCLTKLCSLCLCHNKNIINLSTLDIKYDKFLRKLLNPPVENGIKLDIVYLCELCRSKLESCQILSELCIRNKIYTKFCCMCLSEKSSTLLNLRKVSTDCASFYNKLIRSVRPQTFICEKCVTKLKYYLQFYQECIENNATLQNYIQESISITKESILENIVSPFDVNLVKKEIVDTEVDIEDNFIYKNLYINEYTSQEFNESVSDIKIENVYADVDAPLSNDFIVYSGETEKNVPEEKEKNHSHISNDEEIPEVEENNYDLAENGDASNNAVEATVKKSEIMSKVRIKKEDQSEHSFICPYCPENENITNFRQHKLRHMNRRQKKCLLCEKKFKSYPTLCAHILVHFRSKIQTPKRANPIKKQKNSKMQTKILSYFKNDPNAVNLIIEPDLVNMQPTSNLVCIYCPGKTNIMSIKEHKFQHINRMNNQCLICSRKFFAYKYLYKHIMNHFSKTELPLPPPKEKEPEPIIEKIESNFICPYCPEKTNLTSLVEHKFHHMNREINQCLLCSKKFHAYKYLYRHILIHFKNVPTPPTKEFYTTCPFCPEKTKYNSIKEHKFTHLNKKNMRCLICSQKFVGYKSLSQHVIKHLKNGKSVLGRESTTKTFDCQYCPEKINETFHQHKFRHVDVTKKMCLICSKVFIQINNLKEHVLAHYSDVNIEKQFILDVKLNNITNCPYCVKKVNENTFEHIKKHIDLKNFTCLICSSRYLNYSQIIDHVHKHFLKTNDGFVSSENFNCPFCPDKTKTHTFKTHKFVHMDREQNKCLICGNAFSGYKYLAEHLRKHFKFLKFERKYLKNVDDTDKTFCEVCKVFLTKQYINKHSTSKVHLSNLRNKSTEGTVYTCKNCNKSCKEKGNWIRHIRYDCKSLPPKYSCIICGASFRRQYLYTKHMDLYHN